MKRIIFDQPEARSASTKRIGGEFPRITHNNRGIQSASDSPYSTPMKRFVLQEIEMTAASAGGVTERVSLPPYGRWRAVHHYFGVTRGHAYQLLADGKIKAVRVGGCRFFDLYSIQAFLDALSAAQNSPAAPAATTTDFGIGSGHVPQSVTAREQTGDENKVNPGTTLHSHGATESLQPVKKSSETGQ